MREYMNKRQKKKLYKKLCDKHNIPYSSFEVNRKNHTMKKEETRMIKCMLHNLIDIIRVYSIIFKHSINTKYNFNNRQYDMKNWLKKDLSSEDRGQRLENITTPYQFPGLSCASDLSLHHTDSGFTDIYDKDESSIIPCRMINLDLSNQSNIIKLMHIKEESSNANECKTDLSI